MKAKVVALISLIICAFHLSSCSDEIIASKAIPFSTIGQDNLYGNGQEDIEAGQFIISDASAWEELLAKMNAVNNVSDDFTEVDIDFTKYILIAVFDEVYPNGGHSIDVIRIEEKENTLRVSIDHLLEGGLITIVTQPFHIVQIEKTDQVIIIESL